jgi:hypothetical protein
LRIIICNKIKPKVVIERIMKVFTKGLSGIPIVLPKKAAAVVMMIINSKIVIVISFFIVSPLSLEL